MIAIAAMVAVIVLIIQVYKTANGNGRSGALWAVLTGVLGFGFQIVLPMIIGLVAGIYLVATGGTPDDIQEWVNSWSLLISIPCLILSVLSMWLIMKYVSRIPDDQPLTNAPPPPPSFGG